jgi:hypothetical protein
MAAFDIDRERIFHIDQARGRGFEDARISLLVLSEEVEVSTYLYVQDIATYAEDRLKELVPVGDTGNLRASIKRYLQPVREGRTTTGQFTGEGPWVSKVYFDDRAVGPFYSLRPQAAGATRKTQTDRPIEYALALNDGRRRLDASQFGKKNFAWFNPRMKANTGKGGRQKSPYGYNTFKSVLAQRAGLHFIEQSNSLTAAYAEERTRSFLRGKGRTTATTREGMRRDLGFMVRGDF